MDSIVHSFFIIAFFVEISNRQFFQIVYIISNAHPFYNGVY